MYKIGINFDEISDELQIALNIMKSNQISAGELRTVAGKNFVFWSDNEVTSFKRQVNEAGIELVAAATPLFKWYVQSNDPEVPHDNFGFNPRLSTTDKQRYIQRTFEIANYLQIPRLRIFSGLGVSPAAAKEFANDPLLKSALELADSKNIDLFLENEPVCRIHSVSEITDLFELNTHPRLKFWLDIANLVELGESIDKHFLKTIKPRLGYLHIKDYVVKNNQRLYVPAGEGQINYRQILANIFDLIDNELIITIETHAPHALKIEYSERAITGTRRLLSAIGKPEGNNEPT